MIEIRNLEGERFEVFAPERHSEAFEGKLGAIAAAHALAGILSEESGEAVSILSPWGLQTIERALRR